MTNDACLKVDMGLCEGSSSRKAVNSANGRAQFEAGSTRVAALAVALSLAGFSAAVTPAWAETASAQAAPADAGASAQTTQTQPTQSRQLDINEYRVEGVKLLPQEDVEAAVYPYLGPGRTTDDVEKARAALEQAYNDKGYQTVAVEIPPQRVEGGVVKMQVIEGKIGRLRVKGSRYFSLNEIKDEAPSLAEGTVPNFKDVQRDVVALNQQPDRRVTPSLRAGVAPGTVDVDLNVDDTLPLHGSLEVNNRYSADTTHTRLNATVHYDNLWQLGHSLSLSYQVAPENSADAKVYSGSYLARLPDTSWLSLLVYGVKQDSDVSTVGDINVAGRGEIVGTRAIITLPYEEGFFHTLSLGFDYKHFDEGVTLGGEASQSPITYYPVTAAYTANWTEDDATTQFDATTTFHMRGLGSDPAAFDAKRFKSSGDFIYLHGDLSRTQELTWGMQGYAKIQGQLSSEPLVSAEELSGGGLDTVRGYLESEVLGDNGVLGTIELRSPYIPDLFGTTAKDFFIEDWRVYLFAEGGALSINDPLPEQQSTFNLASIGVGSRIKFLNYVNGSVDLGLPMINQNPTKAYEPRVHFRLWSEF